MPLSSLALRGDNGRPIPNLRPSDVQAVPTPALLTETQTPRLDSHNQWPLADQQGVSSTKRVRRAISRVITHLDDLGPSVNKPLPCGLRAGYGGWTCRERRRSVDTRFRGHFENEIIRTCHWRANVARYC